MENLSKQSLAQLRTHYLTPERRLALSAGLGLFVKLASWFSGQEITKLVVLPVPEVPLSQNTRLASQASLAYDRR